MKLLKERPSWFQLRNYESSEKFGALEWANEIWERHVQFDALRYGLPGECDYQEALKYIEKIKRDPYKNYSLPRDSSLKASFWTSSGNRYIEKRSAVNNLSKFKAYRFLYDSKNKSEIVKDFERFELLGDESSKEERRSLIDKYSHPFTDVVADYHEVFLDVNLRASDEHIVSEFKDWLAEKRKELTEFNRRKKFTQTEFRDWHDFKLLAYWDLTFITSFEGYTVPQHVLGQALFPRDVEVDTTERIRKVVQKKHQFLISEGCLGPLLRQVMAELESWDWYV